ncbi:MAG: hypothetical protein ACK444_12775, partial [Flavobacteriales bacterium]
MRIFLQSKLIGIVSKQSSDKPLLILGNGPSLNATLTENPLERLAHFDLLAVNNAANAELFTQLRPSFY